VDDAKPAETFSYLLEQLESRKLPIAARQLSDLARRTYKV